MSWGQPHYPNVDHCVSYTNFAPKVTGSLVTRLSPKAWPSTQWVLNKDLSDSECNTLTHAIIDVMRALNVYQTLIEQTQFVFGTHLVSSKLT